MSISRSWLPLLMILPTILVPLVPRAYGQTDSPQRMNIQGGRTTWEALDPNTPSHTLNDVMGESNAGLFNRNGYVLQSGHRNRAQSSRFTVSLNIPSLDYGTINKNQSITKDINIVVSFPDLPGYTLSFAQDHPLMSPSGKIIPDTVCDNAKVPCNTRHASTWVNPQIPGFGYRVENPLSSPDFSPPDQYRPFTSLGLLDRRPAIVIQSYTNAASVEQTITSVKLLSLDANSADQFTNTIIITASPAL